MGFRITSTPPTSQFPSASRAPPVIFSLPFINAVSPPPPYILQPPLSLPIRIAILTAILNSRREKARNTRRK